MQGGCRSISGTCGCHHSCFVVSSLALCLGSNRGGTVFGQLSAVVVLIVHVVHLTHGLWHRVFLTDAHCKKAVNSILRRASSVFVDCFSLHLGDRRCGCIDHRRFRKLRKAWQLRHHVGATKRDERAVLTDCNNSQQCQNLQHQLR